MGKKWTPEQKAAARERALAQHAKPKDSFSEVVSVKDVSPSDLAKLQAQIVDLQAKLASSEAGRSVAENKALEMAQAQGTAFMPDVEEVPSGRSVKVQRCKGYKSVGFKDNGQDILKPVFEEVERETFYYKIDMPPVGGSDLKLNGTPYYHGTVYEFDIDTLRYVKDQVWRVWKHEHSIHASDENVYRKPTQAKGAAGIQAEIARIAGRM